MPSGLVPLFQPLMAVVAGAMRATEGHDYRPVYPSPLMQCSVDAWPAAGSKLGRLVSALQEPGAVNCLYQHLRHTLTSEISQQLRSMDYPTFLRTQYWWIVRGVLVARRGLWCEDCKQLGSVLDAHHLTYRHRGEEVFHLEDLKLLCRRCHMERHTE
jgi:hypothetical protein